MSFALGVRFFLDIYIYICPSQDTRNVYICTDVHHHVRRYCTMYDTLI